MGNVVRPKCSDCGSLRMVIGGLTAMHWFRGRLRQAGRAEVVDGAPWHCQECGAKWRGNPNPPFDLEREVEGWRL